MLAPLRLVLLRESVPERSLAFRVSVAELLRDFSIDAVRRMRL